MGLRLGFLAALIISQAAIADCPPPRCDGKTSVIVVGSAVGSSTDAVARLLAKILTTNWGSPVIVENRPGQAGLIAAAQVAKAAPDSSTVLVANSSLLSASALSTNLAVKLDEDIVPVALVSSSPFTVVAPSAANIRSIPDLVAEARRSPGRVTYGSSGTGALDHFATELLNSSAGIRSMHVPYKGSQAAIADLMAGNINYAISPYSAVSAAVRDGKVRTLATTGRQRSPALPDAPTLVELGYQGMVFEDRVALYVPRGMPVTAMNGWNRAVNGALKSTELRQLLARQGAAVQETSVDEIRKVQASEANRLSNIARSAAIKIR